MKSTSVEQFLRSLVAGMDPTLAELGAEELSILLTKMGLEESAVDNGKPPARWQDALIEELIPSGSSVLDLGCGDGQLLAKLIHDKTVRGQGIELAAESVFHCVQRGVPVIQSNLDAGLKGFPEKSFDYVILEETLQTLHRPNEVLDEVLRVARTGIISFPNFGYWQVRLGLAVGGRMPISSALPYLWYNTPNIHLLTLNDFYDWANKNKVHISKGFALAEGKIRPLGEKDALYAEEVLLVIKRDEKA